MVSTWPVKPERLWQPATGRQPTKVRGFDATYGDLDPNYGPYPLAVLWADEGGQWFRVSCDTDRSGVLDVAEHVHAGLTTMRVPFTLTSLPQGLSLVALIASFNTSQPTVTAQFQMPGLARPLVMSISNVTDDWYAQGPVQTQTFSGRKAVVRASSQTICFATASDPVCISGPGDEPATDWSPAARTAALQTAEHLIPVADPADVSSWIDADVALPG